MDWLVLGDCTLILGREGAPEVISDDRLAAVARDERAAMKAAPPDSEERRYLHGRLVKAERALRNRPGGYWVAAADPLAAGAALYGTRPRKGVRQAALLTDGAARLATLFTLADWAECLSMLACQGPERLVRHVRDAELGDVAGTRWPRGKVHDDATAVYVSL